MGPEAVEKQNKFDGIFVDFYLSCLDFFVLLFFSCLFHFVFCFNGFVEVLNVCVLLLFVLGRVRNNIREKT